jgi:hypothetical protein
MTNKLKRKDHVRADPRFSYLKDNAVTFYNIRASALKVKRWAPRVPASFIVY